MVGKKVFYCRYEGDYSQRHLEASRAERKISRLNMAGRIDWAVRGERMGRGREEEKREGIRRGERTKRVEHLGY